MNITVAISNKTYWVPTWKMLSAYAKKSRCSQTKMACTNPDGTVSVDIDHEYIADLIDELQAHNKQYKGTNTLSLLVSEKEVDYIRRLVG